MSTASSGKAGKAAGKGPGSISRAEYHREYYQRVVKPKRESARSLTLSGSCYYCGLNKRLTLDHIIPRGRGGSDEQSNLVWACSWCNRSKGGQFLEDWRLALAKKLIAWPDLRPHQIEWLRSLGFDAEAVAASLLPEVKFAFEGRSTLQRWSSHAQHKK